MGLAEFALKYIPVVANREKVETKKQEAVATEVTVFESGVKMDAGGSIGNVHIIDHESAILDRVQLKRLQIYEAEQNLPSSAVEKLADGRFLVKMIKQE